jgi:L-cysteine/cystine lyase
MTSSPAHQRKLFTYLDRYAYFNYGGQGSLPRAAINLMHHAQIAMQEIAPFSLAANDFMNQETAALRSLMAEEVGAPIASMSIVENTTVGCNIALWGIDWRPGDRLLLTDCEHQGIIATAQELQRRYGVTIDVCPILAAIDQPDTDLGTIITQAIHPSTRMVALSHVLWNTGAVLPLAEIAAFCRSRNVLTMVDAAQSVGVLPLDLTALGVDFYAFTGHKWWCGPQGVGGLYVRPEVQDQLHPTFIGWRSVITNAQGQPQRYQSQADRYEVATSAVPLFAGLRKALEIHRAFGSADDRYELIKENATLLWERLQELPQVRCLRSLPPASGLIAFELESGKHKEAVQKLEAQGLLVRQLLNPNCIRACTHYMTTEAEIERLVGAIEAL